jgi:hypothetical protein
MNPLVSLSVKTGTTKEGYRAHQLRMGGWKAGLVEITLNEQYIDAYPGTLSTQSPHPLFLLNIDNIPSCVPITIFVPL